MSATKEKTAFMDLEPLICDSHNMVDVLLNLVEQHFSCPPPENGNYVISESEGQRLFFVASVAESMSHKAKKSYYEAFEGKTS
ncbi:MAG: hypothetical protein E5X81_20810 [Mesorhizobium sp.]|nr:MAG: hypothetical protein E5X81_20810 [Mesorhizobium sp.]